VKPSPLSEFCDKLGIPDNIKHAFAAYLRTDYASKFKLSGEGETIHIVISRLTQAQLEDAWQQFIKDLVKYLSK